MALDVEPRKAAFPASHIYPIRRALRATDALSRPALRGTLPSTTMAAEPTMLIRIAPLRFMPNV